MNKGCDFVVLCDPPILREDGKNFKNPRHKDLIREFKNLSEHNPDYKARLLEDIKAVWQCEDVTEVSSTLCNNIKDSDFVFRCDRALKVAKWLFIEQDITDWNTSGRSMLMNGINLSLT